MKEISSSTSSTESPMEGDPRLWVCSVVMKRRRMHAKLTFLETSLQLVMEHESKKKRTSASYKPKTEMLELPFDLIASIGLLSPETELSKTSLKESLCCRRGDDSGKLYELDDEVILKLIYYNPKLNKKKKELPKEVIIIVDQAVDYEENLGKASKLCEKVTQAINTGATFKRPILLILNPFSGKGKSQKIFEEKVRPMLDKAGIGYEMIATRHARHATEIIREAAAEGAGGKLAQTYSAVVTLSGDGLLFEVVNGFVESLEQSSTAATIKKIPIPIGIIPGGSGNGLAYSLNSLYMPDRKASTDELFEATLHVIKGRPNPMDIVRFTTPTRIYYSFLSFGWGLMADIDIESERLRFLGEPRFTIWSLYRTLSVRKYPGTLAYLPVDSKSTEPIPTLDQAIPEHWTTVTGHFVMLYASYQRYLNSSVKFAPEAKLADGTIYLAYIQGDVSSCQLIRFLMATESGGHVKLNYVNFVAAKAFRLVPEQSDNIVTIDGEQIDCSPIQAEVQPSMAEILVRRS